MLSEKIYSYSNKTNFTKTLLDSLIDIKKSNFLAIQFAKRDIQSQYRQSFLGIVWLFFTPLVSTLVWILLNNSGTLDIADTGMPYPVFVFSGTLFWSILLESINSPTLNTNGARSFISKINFPKEALIISGIYKLLFNSSIKIILLIIFVLVYGIGFHWYIFLFPFVLGSSIVVGTAIGLFLTPIGLLYNDISKLITVGFSLLIYLTPVLYGIPSKDPIKSIMIFNPFTPLVTTLRSVLVGHEPQFLIYFIILSVCSVILFFFSLVFYRISIPIVVERLSA